jgi:hypothetical protein
MLAAQQQATHNDEFSSEARKTKLVHVWKYVKAHTIGRLEAM